LIEAIESCRLEGITHMGVAGGRWMYAIGHADDYVSGIQVGAQFCDGDLKTILSKICCDKVRCIVVKLRGGVFGISLVKAPNARHYYSRLARLISRLRCAGGRGTAVCFSDCVVIHKRQRRCR
jgi:hypothetical protein